LILGSFATVHFRRVAFILPSSNVGEAQRNNLALREEVYGEIRKVNRLKNSMFEPTAELRIKQEEDFQKEKLMLVGDTFFLSASYSLAH
jgi:hypothetical protein